MILLVLLFLHLTLTLHSHVPGFSDAFPGRLPRMPFPGASPKLSVKFSLLPNSPSCQALHHDEYSSCQALRPVNGPPPPTDPPCPCEWHLLTLAWPCLPRVLPSSLFCQAPRPTKLSNPASHPFCQYLWEWNVRHPSLKCTINSSFPHLASFTVQGWLFLHASCNAECCTARQVSFHGSYQ